MLGYDLTRQALAKYANQLFLKVIEAYLLNDIIGVASHGQTFLDLVEDMDTLLACHDGFLLGPWLESAKKLAQDEEQEKQVLILLTLLHSTQIPLNMSLFYSPRDSMIQFEWDARTQITMWFDNASEEASLLRDYGKGAFFCLLLLFLVTT